jgi:short-subunit dehydrogenase
MSSAHPLAVVTGASSGIGRELARCCAREGFDLVIVADEPQIDEVARELRSLDVEVTPVAADLAQAEGLAALFEAVGERRIDALLANAGTGLGGGFLDQPLDEAQRIVDLNIEATMALVHHVGGQMRRRGEGRILITGSIAGYLPGSYQAVYNASKAFLDSFAFALRYELEGSGVGVTCLMPGLTDTDFFERAGMQDSFVGQTGLKSDPAKVAAEGVAAMMKGESGQVTDLLNKLQVLFAGVVPDEILARLHRRVSAPGSGRDR